MRGHYQKTRRKATKGKLRRAQRTTHEMNMGRKKKLGKYIQSWLHLTLSKSRNLLLRLPTHTFVISNRCHFLRSDYRSPFCPGLGKDMSSVGIFVPLLVPSPYLVSTNVCRVQQERTHLYEKYQQTPKSVCRNLHIRVIARVWMAAPLHPGLWLHFLWKKYCNRFLITWSKKFFCSVSVILNEVSMEVISVNLPVLPKDWQQRGNYYVKKKGLLSVYFAKEVLPWGTFIFRCACDVFSATVRCHRLKSFKIK